MKIILITCTLLSAFGLISAAPRYIYPNSILRPRPIVLYTNSHTINPIDETAKSQWIGAATRLVGSTIGSRILNNVVDCRVCGKCNTELQQDTGIEERSAKIMALLQVMDEINVAKESLNELNKFSMKDDRNVEAQLNELVSGKISSIGDALGNASEYLKGAAKNVLCH